MTRIEEIRDEKDEENVNSIQAVNDKLEESLKQIHTGSDNAKQMEFKMSLTDKKLEKKDADMMEFVNGKVKELGKANTENRTSLGSYIN